MELIGKKRAANVSDIGLGGTRGCSSRTQGKHRLWAEEHDDVFVGCRRKVTPTRHQYKSFACDFAMTQLE